MENLKFIHTADLHLGTPLESSYELPQKLSEIVKNATYLALERICDLAIYNEVDFIIFSGDIFDHEAHSIKAEEFLKEQLGRLEEQNISIFMIAGNHDPLGEESIDYFKELDKLHLFGSEKAKEKEVFANNKLQARIIGQSYRGRAESRKMINYFTPTGEESFNIGILHTQLDPNNKNYVPCSLEEIKNKKGIDYWALGHIHKGEILSSHKPAVVFPGTPQGRHIGEIGPKGCLLVTVENKKLTNINFLATSPVIWLEKEISIDESIEDAPENITELEEYLVSRGKDFVEKNIYDILTEYEYQLPGKIHLETNNIENSNNYFQENHYTNHYDYAGQEIKGYIIRWVITGRTSLHGDVEEQPEEIKEVLLDGLRKRLKDHIPFVWSDSLQFRTTKPLPSLEELKKQSDIFDYIDRLAEKYLTDPELQKQLLKSFGEIWEWQEDHEDYDERKLQLDENTFASLVEQSKRLAIEKLLERREDN